MYDFEYLNPLNFDGVFKKFTQNNLLYNGNAAVPEEDETFLDKLGILLSSKRENFGGIEKGFTQSRTVEDTSIDYYLYRFGLSYEDLKKNNIQHLRKFLKTDGDSLYLPQYENSYYFYFGLKNGATAIEEFNKQFFSDCGNSKLISFPKIEIM